MWVLQQPPPERGEEQRHLSCLSVSLSLSVQVLSKFIAFRKVGPRRRGRPMNSNVRAPSLSPCCDGKLCEGPLPAGPAAPFCCQKTPPSWAACGTRL